MTDTERPNEPDYDVVDNAEQSRFEIRVGDELAGYAVYKQDGSTRSFTHTVVEPRWEGRGVGTELAARALSMTRGRDLTAVPVCSFIQAHVEKHPDSV